MMKFLTGNVLSRWLVACVAVGFALGQVQAAPVVFLVESNQSSVTLSGTVEGATLQAQGTGSLTTSLFGNIQTEVTGSTIQFVTSNGIVAANSGTWQPAVGGGSGSAPANYGGTATIEIFTAYAAIRNAVLSLNSSTLTLSGNNFDSTQLIFGLTNSSSMDYYVQDITSGTEPLTGLSTNSVANGATLTTSGSVQTLNIQINTTFTFTGTVPAVLTLKGQIVATNAPVSAFMIDNVGLTNRMLVLTVQNASSQSVLQGSTDLSTWSPASSTVTTNGSGATFYTIPIGGTGNSFFRVKQ